MFAFPLEVPTHKKSQSVFLLEEILGLKKEVSDKRSFISAYSYKKREKKVLLYQQNQIVKIGITKIFCYNKMFGSINKTFGCSGKIFGCSNKNFICCP